ncbi:MAG: pyridoxamine 5'-phosphate oxidase family protein [Actinobacteria bacterium]|nr:pyridoxamine 5'-phosphate oxidase family protein [Actinomycetota bacterium]
MTEPTTLTEVQAFATALSPLAHLATISADGTPDVVPVHPAWRDGTLWVAVGTNSVKAVNIAANPSVAMHWQVSEAGDGVEVWGQARVHTDVETKRELWEGVFDYDLNLFMAGPDSPDAAMISITPTRALIIKAYGAAGMARWTAD